MCKFSDKRPTDQNDCSKKPSHLSALKSLKKDTKWSNISQSCPKGVLIYYHKYPLVFFTVFECESRQLWGDAGSKSCPSGNVREGLSDWAALKSMRARIMWLISSALALRSEGAGSEPCRESVLASYQEEIAYTLPLSRNRTQGRLLLFTSIRTPLQCLSDVFMIIWQDRRTHSLTHTHFSTRSTNPASVMHSFDVVKSCFDEICGGLSTSWWKLSISSRYVPQLKKYTDSFTFSRLKSPTREKWHDYRLLAWK